jgi:hypothetical protein
MVLSGATQQVTVRDAEERDAEAILADIRAKDRSEWVCGTGLPTVALLRWALRTGEMVRVAVDPEGRPLAVWGLDTPTPYSEAAKCRGVWLAATNRAERYILSFHRFLGPELDKLHAVGGTLHALADNRNAIHLKWLRRIGFVPIITAPTGPFGLPYTLFRRNKCVTPLSA